MPSILNNVAALSATRQIGITQAGLKSTIERLTTGKRINRAADDAAGLANATSLKLDSIVAKETRRVENNRYFAAQAQDGYLEEATNLVMRAMELVAGGNASSAELSSVDGLAVAAFAKAQLGSTLTALGSTTTSVTAALSTINSSRGTLAATMAQAASNANLFGIEEENKTAQMSQIMDADVGAEVVQLTKWQILNQSGINALSQANQSSQTVLGLLR